RYDGRAGRRSADPTRAARVSHRGMHWAVLSRPPIQGNRPRNTSETCGIWQSNGRSIRLRGLNAQAFPHPKSGDCMFTDSSEVLKFIKDEDVKFLDIRFTDLPGVQQHFNIPASTVDEEFFTVGQLFDGSSIRGFANIHESDMQLIPDVTTAYVDPFRVAKTLVIVFDIYNPRTGDIYHRDPRQVANKAQQYLASTGIADTAFFAPEAEFYIFD